MKHTFWVPIKIQSFLKVSVIRGPGDALLLRARTEGLCSTLQRREVGQTDGRTLLGKACLFPKVEFLFRR